MDIERIHNVIIKWQPHYILTQNKVLNKSFRRNMVTLDHVSSKTFVISSFSINCCFYVIYH